MCGEMANRGRICGCVELGLKHSLDHLFPRSLALDGRYCRDRKKRLNLMRPLLEIVGDPGPRQGFRVLLRAF